MQELFKSVILAPQFSRINVHLYCLLQMMINLYGFAKDDDFLGWIRYEIICVFDVRRREGGHPITYLINSPQEGTQFDWSTYLPTFIFALTQYSFNQEILISLDVAPRGDRKTLFQIMSPPFQQWIILLKVWQAEIPQIQPTFTTTKKQEGN